jgi:lipopolysaccharide export system ATP-binding protein
LDEPFAGVDPIAVEELQKIILNLKTKNIGVLITDQNVHELLEITDRAYIIYEGNVLIQGTSSEIIAHELDRERFLGDKFTLRRDA